MVIPSVSNHFIPVGGGTQTMSYEGLRITSFTSWEGTVRSKAMSRALLPVKTRIEAGIDQLLKRRVESLLDYLKAR